MTYKIKTSRFGKVAFALIALTFISFDLNDYRAILGRMAVVLFVYLTHSFLSVIKTTDHWLILRYTFFIKWEWITAVEFYSRFGTENLLISIKYAPIKLSIPLDIENKSYLLEEFHNQLSSKIVLNLVRP